MSAATDTTFDVALFGEAMLLLVANEPGPLEHATGFHKRTAGAETNVAIGLARLGLKVGWASRLGTDSMGRSLLATMQAEGIDCSHVTSDATQRTGFQFKERVTDGRDPKVEYHRKGSAASQMGPADVDEPWLRSARHLHATGVFAAISETSLQAAQRTLQVMRAAGRTISFDPNLRPTLWSSPEVMRHQINELSRFADWVLPGMEEGCFSRARPRPRAWRAFTEHAEPNWWSSSLASRAPISTVMWRAQGMSPASPWPRWWTPWVRATALPWASSARCCKAAACPMRCAAVPGLAPGPYRCWAIPRGCPRGRSWSRPAYEPQTGAGVS